jgi:regulatory protein RepA
MTHIMENIADEDIRDFFTREPEPDEYVLPGLMPGTVGSIVSPGGQGKSILALMLSCLVGGAIDLLDLGIFPMGNVVYLSAEDSRKILHKRFFHIGAKLDTGQRENCIEGVRTKDLTKHNPDLINGEHAVAWRDAIEKLAEGSRLLILDTLRSFHSSDENNSTTMSVLMGYLRAIAARTGCAIIFLHHTSKSSATGNTGDQQQASRGSSVLTDNIRWQAYLAGMSSEESEKLTDDDGQPIGEDRGYYVRFGISKQNYGSPFTEKWYKRGRGGILEPASLSPATRRLEIVGRKESGNGYLGKEKKND